MTASPTASPRVCAGLNSTKAGCAGLTGAQWLAADGMFTVDGVKMIVMAKADTFLKKSEMHSTLLVCCCLRSFCVGGAIARVCVCVRLRSRACLCVCIPVYCCLVITSLMYAGSVSARVCVFVPVLSYAVWVASVCSRTQSARLSRRGSR